MKKNLKEEKKAFVALVFSLIRMYLFLFGFAIYRQTKSGKVVTFINDVEKKRANVLLYDVWEKVKGNDCYAYYFQDKVKIISSTSQNEGAETETEAHITVELKGAGNVTISIDVLPCGSAEYIILRIC